MFNQYLTVTYQYLINAYIIKAIFNQSWPIFKNNSYRLVILRQAMAWTGTGLEIHNPLSSTEILSSNKKATR